MSFRESWLERKATKYAEELGYLHFKISPAGQAGWPDHVYISKNGTHVYIEYKASGNKLRKLQAHRQSQLKRHNVCVYGPVDTLFLAKEVLDRHVCD